MQQYQIELEHNLYHNLIFHNLYQISTIFSIVMLQTKYASYTFDF